MSSHCLAARAQPPAPPSPTPVRAVIVIIKTHFDIGYTHCVKEIVHHYRTEMIDKAMNIMDQSKTLPPEQQFAWTGPGWVMSKVLEDWDAQTPARRKRLDDYVKAGKFMPAYGTRTDDHNAFIRGGPYGGGTFSRSYAALSSAGYASGLLFGERSEDTGLEACASKGEKDEDR